MEKKFRVGLIGVGSIAHIAHLPILAARDDVEMVGAIAKEIEDVQECQKSYAIEHAAHDIGELIDLGLDCAFVLSPKDVHAEQVVRLLQEGIDVFCEKPMGMTLKEAAAMADAAEKSGKKLMIGFNRRYAPVYRKAKEAMGRSAPDVLVAQKNRPASEYRATLENAVHMVDILRYFCGECTRVEAYSKFTDPMYETLTTAQLQFENGSVAMLVADRASGQWMETLEMHGQNKSIQVTCPDTVTITDQEQFHTTSMTPLAYGWAKVTDKMGFTQEDGHFFDCLKNNRQPLTNGADAYKTQELMHRILTAAGLPGLE
ncbi:Gfo/Idh/MocA family oxidoreductase [Caproiciproducens sp. NJN-50]|uniref:Gfo/Idh/MocA family protein n=1 Tax=Acutalibacteraceae TaxID=3082771 RepID=UPI000FFE2929|nr:MULTISPECIES: Gfo/Idh/MocA family oxidoreductase [Acutalibacteraceae]QAT50047.1 Gfo/Idh/MocA family oxidoreductase [Caproiciproducens sp. NJN-50]